MEKPESTSSTEAPTEPEIDVEATIKKLLQEFPERAEVAEKIEEVKADLGKVGKKIWDFLTTPDGPERARSEIWDAIRKKDDENGTHEP